MKFFNITAVVCMAYQAVHAETIFDRVKEALTKTVSTTKAPSGAIVEVTSWDEHSERVITFPQTKFTDDFHQQADFISRMTEHIRDIKARKASGENTQQPIYDCINRMGDLKPG